MSKYIPDTDIIGKKYNRLTVLYFAEPKVTNSNKKVRRVVCKCDCGNIKNYSFEVIKNGRTKSCGCYNLEKSFLLNRKHGLGNSPIYNLWVDIKYRCKNIKNSKYGGRGIKVCKLWQDNFISFYNWCLSNGWQNGLQIDRKNNNKGYMPSNCHFVTGKVNCRNRRSTVRIKYNNQTKSLIEWCEVLKIDYSMIRQRIQKRKWNVKEAFETPPKRNNKPLK